MQAMLSDEVNLFFGSDHTTSYALAAKISIETKLKRKPFHTL